MMTIDNKPLVLDLIEWIAVQPRPWRTSRPGLPIWEDAVDVGFVVRVHRHGGGAMVDVTLAGRPFLRAERRP